MRTIPAPDRPVQPPVDWSSQSVWRSVLRRLENGQQKVYTTFAVVCAIQTHKGWPDSRLVYPREVVYDYEAVVIEGLGTAHVQWYFLNEKIEDLLDHYHNQNNPQRVYT